MHQGGHAMRRQEGRCAIWMTGLVLSCVVAVSLPAQAELQPAQAQPQPAGSEPQLAQAELQPAQAQKGIRTVVGILPQAEIVRRVGGEHVVVSVLVDAGQDPHTYEPTPRQIMDVSAARVLFTVGLPFENRVTAKLADRESNLLIVDMTAGIERRVMLENDDHDEAHGHGHAHDHGHDHAHDHGHDHGSDADAQAGSEFRDPHVWLAPSSIARMARNTAQTLSSIAPAFEAEFSRNLEAYLQEIADTDALLREQLAPLRGERFFVFHPAFGYFADAYGLTQVAVETEGKQPTPKRLSALIERARADAVRMIFVQPQFSPQSAQMIARAIGGVVVPMDPLAPDILENLKRMGTAVQTALGGPQGESG